MGEVSVCLKGNKMQLDISRLDPNFMEKSITAKADYTWLNVLDEPIQIHGLAVKEENMFARMPVDTAKSVSEGVYELNFHTAGGRARFKTNSRLLAFIAESRFEGGMNHMPLSGSAGLDVYANGKFIDGVRPVFGENGLFENIIYHLPEGEKNIEVNFPLYNGLKSLYVGICPGSSILPPEKYAIQKPIVYYGSSITQAGCASRPGNSYQGHISRWLNADYINLGFSGNGRGEREMAEYIASLEMSAFVLDYDHNAYNPAYLNDTHEAFFKIIRNAQPLLPVIFVSRPDTGKDIIDDSKRRAVIKATYERAKKSGDRHVYYIDGRRLFGTKDRDACTVDNTHPNDLGFYRMAKTIYPVLKKAFEESI